MDHLSLRFQKESFFLDIPRPQKPSLLPKAVSTQTIKKVLKLTTRGQHGGQYLVRSVQLVFHTALKKAGINKKVGIHSLRHSYATHLIEQGTDIRFVQDLLGYQSVKTTMRYTALTDATKRKIKSPLDHLLKT